MKILCVGDAMIPPDKFGAACEEILKDYAPEVQLTDWLGVTDKAHLQNERIKVEKGGPGAVPIPGNVRGMIADCEVLLVHYCPDLRVCVRYVALVGSDVRPALQHV